MPQSSSKDSPPNWVGGGSGFQHMNFEVGTNIHSITATIYDFVYGKSEMLTQTKIAIR